MAKMVMNWAEFDLIIYTDDSTSNGNKNGGAGIVFMKEPLEEVDVIHTVSIPASKWCSFFQAEIKAIAFALKNQELKTVRIASEHPSRESSTLAHPYYARTKQKKTS